MGSPDGHLRLLDGRAAAAFQSWVAAVGAQMRGPITLPEDDTPFWHLDPSPLAGYRSADTLPEQVDLMVKNGPAADHDLGLVAAAETATASSGDNGAGASG